MTGSTLAAILIPPAGAIFLVAWLALVFYAGRDRPLRAGRNPAPGRRNPGTVAPTSLRQADARPPDRGHVAVTAPQPAAPPAGHSRTRHDDRLIRAVIAAAARMLPRAPGGG